MNWIDIYKKVLENICEKPMVGNANIVDVDFEEIRDKLQLNENAKDDSLFKFKLREPLNEKDCRIFCESVYTYIGLDIYDFLPEKSFKKFKK